MLMSHKIMSHPKILFLVWLRAKASLANFFSPLLQNIFMYAQSLDPKTSNYF